MKKWAQKRNESGFTIIEVMIVLAIAGIIMLLVFLAIPALQRNNRNTQIKSDSANLLGLIAEYRSNRNGANPSAVCSNVVTGEVFILATGACPNTNPDNLRGRIRAGTPVTNLTAMPVPASNTLYAFSGRKCISGSQFEISAATVNARSYAVVYYTETAGSALDLQCQDS